MNSFDSIIRVFPRKTKATPKDKMAFFGLPGLFVPKCNEVHISVTFTWDIPRAERLANGWYRIASVKIGGPGTNMKGMDFTPGLYLKPGYVITSRGCPNKCWFCSVWKREGNIRELPITNGWNILDDNLLSCSDQHIRKVFEMLGRQHSPIEFTGGLEAARLKDYQIDLLSKIKPKQMFFAYDTPDDYDPLRIALSKLKEAGFNRHALRVYVLIGYPQDTIEKAEIRLRKVIALGAYPMAMLWRNEKGTRPIAWRSFQRSWSRPAIIHGKLKTENRGEFNEKKD